MSFSLLNCFIVIYLFLSYIYSYLDSNVISVHASTAHSLFITNQTTTNCEGIKILGGVFATCGLNIHGQLGGGETEFIKDDVPPKLSYESRSIPALIDIYSGPVVSNKDAPPPSVFVPEVSIVQENKKNSTSRKIQKVEISEDKEAKTRQSLSRETRSRCNLFVLNIVWFVLICFCIMLLFAPQITHLFHTTSTLPHTIIFN
jgi:hypothetical protein